MPVVDGSLSIINKKSYGWSRSHYFRLAEKKLRCWNGIPKEFQSQPKKRWFSPSCDNPKQEWDTSHFKYIAKGESTHEIIVVFLDKLGKEPLHLEAPTAEEHQKWINALELECKAELSRNGFVESKPEEQLKEKQIEAKRIEQKIKKENEQTIQKREELACITNPRDNSNECLKNRLIELQRQRKGYENEKSSNEPVLENEISSIEKVMKRFSKNDLKNEVSKLTNNLILDAKPDAPDLVGISNFMKTFDIQSVREAVSIIFTVRRELLATEIRNIKANTNQQSKERLRIQNKKFSAEIHVKDLNHKIAEYNVGARALMEAQKKHNSQIRIWRDQKSNMERDYKNSLEEYAEEAKPRTTILQD